MERKKKNYLNNKDLFNEIIKSQRLNKRTDKLDKMLILLVDRVIRKFYYKNPQDKLDCQQEAYYTILKQWNKFNPRISTNAFAWTTEIVKRSIAGQFNYLYKQKGNRGKKVKIFSLDTNMDGEGMIV